MLYHYAEPDREIADRLARRTGARARRMERMIAAPDLSRAPHSPLYHIVEAIKRIDVLKDADNVVFPEAVPTAKNFDLLGFPPDHPSRSESDTFYIDPLTVLRTHTTAMWSYYLCDSRVKERLRTTGELCAISYGKVYRNDEIDRGHFPVFHQIDGLSIRDNGLKHYSVEDLVEVLILIAKAVFGPEVEWRVEDDYFPFTRSSIEFQISHDGAWLEVLGAGLVNPDVLTLLGLDSRRYNGWAFGFGLDRLALIKADIPDIRILWSDDERIRSQFTDIDSRYVPVSKYPPVDRDVSFVIGTGVPLNALYELMRECGTSSGEDIIEEVRQIDSYENEKLFGRDRISRTFRLRYRSHVRSLTNSEINTVQERVRLSLVEELGAQLR